MRIPPRMRHRGRMRSSCNSVPAPPQRRKRLASEEIRRASPPSLAQNCPPLVGEDSCWLSCIASGSESPRRAASVKLARRPRAEKSAGSSPAAAYRRLRIRLVDWASAQSSKALQRAMPRKMGPFAMSASSSHFFIAETGAPTRRTFASSEAALVPPSRIAGQGRGSNPDRRYRGERAVRPATART